MKRYSSEKGDLVPDWVGTYIKCKCDVTYVLDEMDSPKVTDHPEQGMATLEIECPECKSMMGKRWSGLYTRKESKTPSYSLVTTEELRSDDKSEIHWWNPATDVHRVGARVYSPAEWRQINAERLYVSVGGIPERLVTEEQIHRMKNLISQCQINNNQVNEVWEVVDSFLKVIPHEVTT